MNSEGRREWHSRAAEANRYMLQILTIEAHVEVVNVSGVAESKLHCVQRDAI